MSTEPYLVADIGGTHARFALWSPHEDTMTPVHTQRCAAYPTLAAAVRAYLDTVSPQWPVRAAFAVAAPVLGDAVTLVNHPWQFSIAALRAAFAWQSLTVVNDFTALALAIPTLTAADWAQIAGPATAPAGTIAVIGPGTGLGVSGLLPTPQGWAVVQGEGGHRSFAPTTTAELALVTATNPPFPALETLASGNGLAWIYRHLAQQAHPPHATLPPADGLAAAVIAHRHADPLAAQAVEQFCGVVGSAAGDLALTLGAVGGVYLGGGILPRLGVASVRASPLAARFVAKQGYSDYLQAIPLRLITAEHPTLRGVTTLFAEPTYGVTATLASSSPLESSHAHHDDPQH